MSAHKSMPLSKEEVMQLVNLVEANPVVYSKETNATNNQLKEATWATITDSFNSLIVSSPRRPEQLRLKWENLKKAARKRSTRIRMNNLKTGGGKPDYIPPDDTLEKVASILGKLKRQTTSDKVKMSIKERNKAIADYYISKRKREEEMHELKKKKLEMCIQKFERRNGGSM